MRLLRFDEYNAIPAAVANDAVLSSACDAFLMLIGLPILKLLWLNIFFVARKSYNPFILLPPPVMIILLNIFGILELRICLVTSVNKFSTDELTTEFILLTFVCSTKILLFLSMLL